MRHAWVGVGAGHSLASVAVLSCNTGQLPLLCPSFLLKVPDSSRRGSHHPASPLSGALISLSEPQRPSLPDGVISLPSDLTLCWLDVGIC